MNSVRDFIKVPAMGEDIIIIIIIISPESK